MLHPVNPSHSSLRRLAQREGYGLRKKRGEGYAIIDASTGIAVAGWDFDLEPEDVWKWFNS